MRGVRVTWGLTAAQLKMPSGGRHQNLVLQNGMTEYDEVLQNFFAPIKVRRASNGASLTLADAESVGID